MLQANYVNQSHRKIKEIQLGIQLRNIQVQKSDHTLLDFMIKGADTF